MKRLTNLFFAATLASLSAFSMASEQPHHGDADYDKHAVGVFLGATHAESDTNFTFGAEYAYKFHQQWGVGAGYERTNDAHHGEGVEVWTGNLFYYPIPQLKLGIGAGQEMTEHHDETLYRLSAAYDFHVHSLDMAIAPMVAVDFIDGEEAFVFGVSFVKTF